VIEEQARRSGLIGSRIDQGERQVIGRHEAVEHVAHDPGMHRDIVEKVIDREVKRVRVGIAAFLLGPDRLAVPRRQQNGAVAVAVQRMAGQEATVDILPARIQDGVELAAACGCLGQMAAGVSDHIIDRREKRRVVEPPLEPLRDHVAVEMGDDHP
jgi:hypothetical protein